MIASTAPQDLLSTAKNLLVYADTDTAGLWPRAAALLARQALEDGLDLYWIASAPGVETASARGQLLCLRSYVGEEIAEEAAHAWGSLSRATHHHAYELPPTASELQNLCRSVADVLDALESS